MQMLTTELQQNRYGKVLLPITFPNALVTNLLHCPQPPFPTLQPLICFHLYHVVFQNVIIGSQPLSIIAFFTYHNAFEVCSCHCVDQKLIIFYCGLLFCCINVPRVFSHSPTEGYVDVSNVGWLCLRPLWIFSCWFLCEHFLTYLDYWVAW